MRSILVVPAILAACTLSAASPKSIEELSTHHQVSVIEIADAANPMKINAFCLDAQGQIVAACGGGPGEVRIVNDQGEILKSWELDVKPESISVADDGAILVGGEGRLFRFAADGKLLHEADSPHAERLRSGSEEIRKAAIANLQRSTRTVSAKARVQSYQSIIEQLEKKQTDGELNATETRMLKALPALVERYQAQAAKEEEQGDKPSGPSEEAIKSQIESMIRSKMRISSISSTGDHVLVTTRAVEGYGYDVWKMSNQFTDGKIIVEGLRGCCGQMDVQCCGKGIFVAENSRDRVVHYDLDGNEISHWGKSDRTGMNGFSSCCNPMNVCFDKQGYVYTAEASVGRIKQFDADGKLIAYIGDVDLVPGCKNVSIGVSPVNDNIYMLDLTRNHIKLMQPKPESSQGEPEPTDAVDASPLRRADPTRNEDEVAAVVRVVPAK